MSFFQSVIDEYYSPNVEHAADMGFRVRLSARARQVLEEARANATCAGCGQRISPKVEWTIRNAHTYHPSCGQKVDVKSAAPGLVGQMSSSPVLERGSAPTVIATLVGSAGPLFDPAGCGIPLPDGSVEHESFRSGCFDDSIAKGGQRLRLNHTTTLQGSFERIVEDARELTFRFRLHDGSLERNILTQIKSGAIHTCSVGFTRDKTSERYRWRTIERGRAELNEISLIRGGSRAAWFGTWVRAI